MVALCGDDSVKWGEAENAIKVSLENRIGMWDAVLEEIGKTRES